MIFRFALFVALAFALASCTSTDFQTWEGGNSVVQGHGEASTYEVARTLGVSQPLC
jgi:hypothetical protein